LNINTEEENREQSTKMKLSKILMFVLEKIGMNKVFMGPTYKKYYLLKWDMFVAFDFFYFKKTFLIL